MHYEAINLKTNEVINGKNLQVPDGEVLELGFRDAITKEVVGFFDEHGRQEFYDLESNTDNTPLVGHGFVPTEERTKN